MKFKPRKATTVSELIQILKKLPPHLSITARGADSGGYDVVDNPFIRVHLRGSRNYINNLRYYSRFSNPKIVVSFEANCDD